MRPFPKRRLFLKETTRTLLLLSTIDQLGAGSTWELRGAQGASRIMEKWVRFVGPALGDTTHPGVCEVCASIKVTAGGAIAWPCGLWGRKGLFRAAASPENVRGAPVHSFL